MPTVSPTFSDHIHFTVFY